MNEPYLFLRFVTEDGVEIGKLEKLPAFPRVGDAIQFETKRYEVVDVVWMIISTSHWQQVDIVVA